MAIDEALNRILKEMWRLDEKMTAGEELIQKEKEFYATHLSDIKNYYHNNNQYWQDKK